MKMEIFETKEQYLEMIQAWKDSCAKGVTLGAVDYALYAILRDKDPAKCFASPEKQSKRKLICQGKDGYEAYNRAMNSLKSDWVKAGFFTATYQDKLTEEQFLKVRELLKGGAK